MDKLLNTLNQYLIAAQQLIIKYAPQVWDATLTLERAHAIFDITLLILMTVIAVASVWIGIKRLDDDGDAEWGWAALLAAGGILGVVVVCVWCSSFDDLIGMFNPKLEILYHLADKAGLL